MSYGKGLIVAAVLVTVGLPSARADLLWYNGDFNSLNALANERNTSVTDSRVYDNFTLSSNVFVNRIFSNNLLDSGAPSSGFNFAYWEIRSGVSVGNGGTLLYSGTSAATQVATGRSAFGLNEFTVAVGGLNLALNAGTYWLTVAPMDGGVGRSYITTTSGANAVGYIAGGSFWDSIDFGQNFSDPTTMGDEFHDFSMGLEGILSPVVPAPAGVQLGAIGATVALAAYSLRRFRARRSIRPVVL